MSGEKMTSSQFFVRGRKIRLSDGSPGIFLKKTGLMAEVLDGDYDGPKISCSFKMLKEQNQAYRYKTIINRWGTGQEREEYRLTGAKPKWAKEAYNLFDWEIK